MTKQELDEIRTRFEKSEIMGEWVRDYQLDTPKLLDEVERLRDVLDKIRVETDEGWPMCDCPAGKGSRSCSRCEVEHLLTEVGVFSSDQRSTK